jgi:phosphatidylglycerophosphate synthase
VSGILKHVPNLLTGMRLACAPALAMLLASGDDRAALGIFAFAGLSDAADGFLAKRFNLATSFGRFLDPAADKLLMLASFLALAALRAAPVWLTALVIARDVAIVAGILLARFWNCRSRSSRSRSERSARRCRSVISGSFWCVVVRFRLAAAHENCRLSHRRGDARFLVGLWRAFASGARCAPQPDRLNAVRRTSCLRSLSCRCRNVRR